MKLSFTGHKYAIKDALIIILCIPVAILAFTVLTNRNPHGIQKSQLISSLFFLPSANSPALARLNGTSDYDSPTSRTKRSYTKDLVVERQSNVSTTNFTELNSSESGPSAGSDSDMWNSPMKYPYAKQFLLHKQSNISSQNSTKPSSGGSGPAGELLDSSDIFESADSFSDGNLSETNASAIPGQSPLQPMEKLLICTHDSAHPCISSPEMHDNSIAGNGSAHFNLSSVQQPEPVITNYSSVQLHSYPSEKLGNYSSYSKDSMILPDTSLNKETPIGDELDQALAKTADDNKTLILTTLNSAWAENGSMIDLFLESFHIGEGTDKLLDHLLIVAVDAKAYDRCTKIHPHCYILRTQGVDFSAEKKFMTEDYLKMMWWRLGFLGDILKRGYHFVFTDTDIMWLRNPFRIFSQNADIQIASDIFNGRPEDIRNRPNCGFKFVRSNNKTISFYDYWYRSRRLFPTKNEQEVMNLLKYRRSFKKWGMKFLFLDSKNFGGFCQRSQFIDETYTMHANCCKGLEAKLADLRTVLNGFAASKRNSTLQQNGGVPRAKWARPKACPRSWLST